MNFSYKLLVKLGMLFLFIIAALKVSPFAIFLVVALLAYALIDDNMEYTFGILMLLLALSVINPVLVTKDFYFYLVTRGTLFALAVLISFRSGASKNAWFLSPFYFLIGYIAYMMLVSLAGWAPLVSELKALLFFVFITAFIQLVSAVHLKKVNINFIRCVILVIACFYILGSVVVIKIPSVGQSMILLKTQHWKHEYDLASMGSTSLFNGMTWHSQTLGPLIAVLNAYILSDYLCSFRKRSWLYILLLACVPILVYMTSSRTALFAYIISIAASIFFFMKERNISSSKRQKVLLNAIFLFFVLAAVVFVNPGTRNSLEAFLRKAGDASTMDTSESMKESLLKSRLGLAEEGLANFREKPLIGNGFQVSEEMKYIDRSETTMLLSAPVEKGVLPVMVLEEGGIIGAIIMLSFVIAVYVRYSKLRLSCFLATFTTFIALNTGEATFFSTSGSGGILWSICFCSLIIDVDRHRRRLAQQQIQYQAVPFMGGL